MTNNPEIDMLNSRVSSIESRVASAESVESSEHVGVKEGQDGAPQPMIDPKGRKIWEAEWRGDYGVMIAYVPDNALVIDGKNVEVEADDKDGDEVTVTEGSWYLHIYKNETANETSESYEANFDDSATGTRDGKAAKYNIRILDIHNDGYIEKQHVVGSIILDESGVLSLFGNDEASEKISGAVQISGRLDPYDGRSSCGITVTTVSKRDAYGDDKERPARVILDLKNRDPAEQNWGVHKIEFTDKTGVGKFAHILSCEDISIGGKSSDDGKDNIANVVGSDYIEVEDGQVEGDGEGKNTVSQRKVKAKITAGTVDGESGHALLTNDTEQEITARKTFVGQNGKKIDLNPNSIPSECQGNISIHTLKYKDKDDVIQLFHGIFCDDIDLTKIKLEGKTIDYVNVEPKANETVVTFNYTDETNDEIHIPHGLKGKKGDKGDKGDTPEIWGVKNGSVTTIYADGKVIATISDGSDGGGGHTPIITAEKNNGVTTIYVDGKPIAQIEDGGVNQWEQITCISGIRFQVSNGKIQAVLSKHTFYVPSTFDMSHLEILNDQTVDVCDVDELDVVTEEEYSSSSHQFTNKRKRVKVIGTAQEATGQTPFTATALSDE